MLLVVVAKIRGLASRSSSSSLGYSFVLPIFVARRPQRHSVSNERSRQTHVSATPPRSRPLKSWGKPENRNRSEASARCTASENPKIGESDIGHRKFCFGVEQRRRDRGFCPHTYTDIVSYIYIYTNSLKDI